MCAGQEDETRHTVLRWRRIVVRVGLAVAAAAIVVVVVVLNCRDAVSLDVRVYRGLPCSCEVPSTETSREQEIHVTLTAIVIAGA